MVFGDRSEAAKASRNGRKRATSFSPGGKSFSHPISCHHFPGFVYQLARFRADRKSIEVAVRPRKGSAAACSRCHQPAPGYDQLGERRFEFIPLWGFFVFLLYAMRRVDCRRCGAVVVEEVPWGDVGALPAGYCSKRNENLAEEQHFRLRDLLRYNLKTVRAYLLKEAFQQLWDYNSPAWAGKFLDQWCRQTMRSRTEPMKKIARSLRQHRELILNYFRAQKLISSGVVEGLNNKAKVTMRKSYGFRTYRLLELALCHLLDKLPEPESTHDFFERISFMRTFKSLGAIVILFGVAWAQKPADRGAQRPSAATIKPSNAQLAELKMQTYKGTLMDASCAGASKESSGGKGVAADQSQDCKVSASTKEFALRTDSTETLRFDSVGNARAEEAIKNKKKWSNYAATGKPIRAKVSANANGDKLTVMSIN